MTEGLEALKELMNNVIRNDDNLCDKKVAIIEKELKALEIIKDKRLDVRFLIQCFNLGKDYNFYNSRCSNGDELSQEEYDTLKEVLL